MSNKAYLKIIQLLSARDYSEHKLRQKLIASDFPANEIDEAIKLAKEKKYLREEIYAESRAKTFINKGYSQSYINQKLNTENINVNEEFIGEIFEDQATTKEDQIQYLINKKLRGKKIDSYEDQVKIIRFALSKGHSLSDIKQVLKSYTNNSAIEFMED